MNSVSLKALNQCKIVKLLYCCYLAIKMYYFMKNNIFLAVQISVFLNISFKTTYTMGNKIELWLCHKLLFCFESVKGLLLRKNILSSIPTVFSCIRFMKRVQGSNEKEKSETENYYESNNFYYCMFFFFFLLVCREGMVLWCTWEKQRKRRQIGNCGILYLMAI